MDKEKAIEGLKGILKNVGGFNFLSKKEKEGVFFAISHLSKPTNEEVKKILISVAMNGRKGEGKHNERVILQALEELSCLSKPTEIKGVREVLERLHMQQWVRGMSSKTAVDEALKDIALLTGNEKEIRIKYQNIVYEICKLFDTSKEKCTLDIVVDKVKSSLALLTGSCKIKDLPGFPEKVEYCNDCPSRYICESPTFSKNCMRNNTISEFEEIAIPVKREK